MATERPILFEHLPKTAGSTFNSVLRRYYPKAFHIKGKDPLNSIGQFKSLSGTEQKGFSLVHGHGALELEPFMENPFLITFLRHPVDQFLSQYAFILGLKDHDHHTEVSRLDSIEAYMDYAKANFQDNLQTRVLSQDHSWITRQPAADLSFSLEKALKNLERFDLVLLTDCFDASLLLVKKKLGWTKMPWYARVNTTRNGFSKDELDPALIRRIEALQEYDMKLYEWACQRFEEYGSELPKADELKTFRKKNHWYRNVVYLIYRIKGIVGRRSG